MRIFFPTRSLLFWHFHIFAVFRANSVYWFVNKSSLICRQYTRTETTNAKWAPPTTTATKWTRKIWREQRQQRHQQKMQIFTCETKKLKKPHMSLSHSPSLFNICRFVVDSHIFLYIFFFFRNRNTNAWEKCFKRSSYDWLYATHELKQLKYNAKSHTNTHLLGYVGDVCNWVLWLKYATTNTNAHVVKFEQEQNK